MLTFFVNANSNQAHSEVACNCHQTGKMNTSGTSEHCWGCGAKRTLRHHWWAWTWTIKARKWWNTTQTPHRGPTKPKTASLAKMNTVATSGSNLALASTVGVVHLPQPSHPIGDIAQKKLQTVCAGDTHRKATALPFVIENPGNNLFPWAVWVRI